jgi:asparagine synthase (glutamine-hydrolysing)
MTDSISHRGPDDEGYFLAEGPGKGGIQYSGESSSAEVKSKYPRLNDGAKACLGFGFRRLAILDLSPHGHQPMEDQELGLHIVFNGEIYNYIELREELSGLGYAFFSQSDTEVILKAYHAWGEGCVRRFNGIWAFAVWDSRQGRLFCSRDRFGVKPFYYAIHGNILYFGSEIKQLLLTPVDKELNLPMVWRSMKINSLQVYGSETFWTNILALEPGHNLVSGPDGIKIQRYYRLEPDKFEASQLSFGQAVEAYRATFERAVRWQMRSDVEVGSCLSGGLDSSAIVCTASKLTGKPLQTFSSYFGEDERLDERRWISEVAESCGCVSHLTSPNVDDALAWFSRVTWHNDLPLGAGFAAQYGVMRLAGSKGVRVLLDGQGSDELTAGYRHAQYRFLADMARRRKLSPLLRELKAYLGKNGAVGGMTGMAKSLLSLAFPESTLYNLEFRHLRFEPFNREFIRGCREALREPILTRIEDIPGGKLTNFLYNNIYTTSLPTLLHWEDRMSMAASIESRVPFLDHELVELAFSLPSEYKVSLGQGKHVHRQAMKDIVPAAIYQRKDKAVFGSPFHTVWLRGGMKPAVDAVFNSQEFRRRGIWDLPGISARWQKYLKGDNSQAEMIFNIYALEIWFRAIANG